MVGPNHNLIEKIRSALRAAREPENAAPMQRYMKSRLPFLGIKKPLRVATLKPVLQHHYLETPEEWRATIGTLFETAEYREEWYAALDLLGFRAYRSWLDMHALPLCEALIISASWWDIVDEISTRRISVVLSASREELTPILRTWAHDENPWKRRASIIVQLKHKRETDTKLLGFAIIANLHDQDFFLRKAIGWALREFSKTDPNWVEDFVGQHLHLLSNLSRREALRLLWKKNRAMHLA